MPSSAERISLVTGANEGIDQAGAATIDVDYGRLDVLVNNAASLTGPMVR
jgi:NAD(P)-dependent dehydrogenase (short-subunit alcohol dehydrogenase family)